jgi:hypothetical protein
MLLAPNRDVAPAVGESFVVMFEEQFASISRDNPIPRCRAQLVSSPAGGRDNTLACGPGTAQPIPYRSNPLDDGSATREHLIGPVC